MVNSRSLDDLDPAACIVAKRHIALCHEHGIEIIVTSTWRDIESQDALYAIGRTVNPERRTVTNARGGKSWHNYKCAYDVVPLVAGKPVWDATDPLWKEVVRLGKEAGAEAGAEWPSFPDLPHFQVRPKLAGISIGLDQALVRFKEHGTIFTA